MFLYLSAPRLTITLAVFRITKKNKLDGDEFEYWYYELIQMYKNIIGNDI